MSRKIALIGLGYIGKIHLRLLAEHADWEISGLFDIDAKLTKELADKYNVKACRDLEEALSTTDAIVIATPSSTHFEIARKAVTAGKHVFVEKPVTANVADARTLRNLVSEAGVVCHVGHVERFNPAFVASLPYLTAPRFIEVHRLTQYNPRGTDVSVVLDLMMHDLDLILCIVRSNLRRISVSGTTLVSATPDLVNARLEFDNGCVANVTTNRLALHNSRKFRVFTQENLVNINLLDKISEVVTIRNATPDGSNMVLKPGNGLPDKEIAVEYPIILPTNAINEELHAFYKSVVSNKPAGVDIGDAIRVLEIALDIEERLRG